MAQMSATMKQAVHQGNQPVVTAIENLTAEFVALRTRGYQDAQMSTIMKQAVQEGSQPVVTAIENLTAELVAFNTQMSSLQ